MMASTFVMPRPPSHLCGQSASCPRANCETGRMPIHHRYPNVFHLLIRSNRAGPQLTVVDDGRHAQMFAAHFVILPSCLKQEADLDHAARLAAYSSEGTKTKPRRHAGGFYKRKIAAGEELLVLVRGSRGERPGRAAWPIQHVEGI